MTREEHRWLMRDLWLILVLYLGSWEVAEWLGAMDVSGVHKQRADENLALFAGTIPHLTMVVMIVWLLRREYDARLTAIGMRFTGTFKVAVLGAGAGIVLAIMVGALAEFLESALGLDATVAVSGPERITWVAVAVLAIAPAVSEELYFRGLAYTVLCDKTGSRVAGCLLAAVLFASIHVYGATGFFAMVGLAIGLTGLRELTGSLLAPIVGHAVYNGIVLAVGA